MLPALLERAQPGRRALRHRRLRGAGRRAPLGRARRAALAAYVAWEGYEDDMAEFTATLKASRAARATSRRARVAGRQRHDPRRRRVPRPPGGVRRGDPARAPAQRGARRGALRVRRPVHRRDADRTAGRRRPTTIARSSTSRWAPPTPTGPTSTSAAPTSWATTSGSSSPPARSTPPATGQRGRRRRSCRSSTCSSTPTSSSPTPAWAARGDALVRRPDRRRPQAVDQFADAATLEAIGAGVQLEERPRREAVDRGAGCAPRARELREPVRATGGTARAADAVERLVA